MSWRRNDVICEGAILPCPLTSTTTSPHHPLLSIMERLLTLLNGSWKGTYTEQRVPTSLTISATANGSSGNETIKLTGGGKDGWGQFTIYGSANPKDKSFAYIKAFSGFLGGKWHHEGRVDVEGKRLVEGRVAPSNNLNSTWGHFVFEEDVSKEEREAEAERKTQREEAMKKEQQEAAARRKREEYEAARKRREEEETARKKHEEEAATRKKKEREEAARKKREEQEAKVARQKEAARRREADAARRKQEEEANAKKKGKNSGMQTARRPGISTPGKKPAPGEAQREKQGQRESSIKAPRGQAANPSIVKSPTQDSKLKPGAGASSNPNVLEPDNPHYFATPPPHPFAPATGPETSLFTSTLGLVRAENFESPSPPAGPDGLLSSVAGSNDVLRQERLGLLRPEQLTYPPPPAFRGLLSSAQLMKSPPMLDVLLSDDNLNEGLGPRPKQIRIV